MEVWPLGDDVIDLNQKRQRKRPKADAGPTKDEIYEAVAARMNGRPAGRGWPAFPRRYHFVRDEAGRKAFLLEVRNGVVQHVIRQAIEDSILEYTRAIAITQNAALGPRDAENCARIWAATTTPITPAPIALAEASAPGYAFARLSFDAPPDAGDPPARFASFLERSSQPLAIAAFIGSLFYPEADRSQYLYLYGQGRDGKGSLLRFLYKLLGSACQSLQPPGKEGDKFWMMKTYGKRLVFLPDCDSPKFFASPAFKSLTGGDPVYFEEKGVMGFTAIPTCKVIAASNVKPLITSQISDQRRIIYAEMGTVPADEAQPGFENVLLEDAAAIISWCKAVYLSQAPRHGPIKCDAAEQLAAEAEEGFASLFHKHFDVAGPTDWVRGDRVREVLRRDGIRSDQEINRLKAAWERIFGVTARKMSGGRGGCMAYFGMRYSPKDYEPMTREQVPAESGDSGDRVETGGDA